MPDARRYDGWTPEKQKRFLTALARGHNVTKAWAIVGMARQTAYALRDSAGGAGFALGWKVARLRACDSREGAKNEGIGFTQRRGDRRDVWPLRGVSRSHPRCVQTRRSMMKAAGAARHSLSAPLRPSAISA